MYDEQEVIIDFFQPLNSYLCDGNDQEVMKIRIADTERMGVAGILTEWCYQLAYYSISNAWIKFCRGAYSSDTVPGSKPYKDGLEITVSQNYRNGWLVLDFFFFFYADFG